MTKLEMEILTEYKRVMSLAEDYFNLKINQIQAKNKEDMKKENLLKEVERRMLSYDFTDKYVRDTLRDVYEKSELPRYKADKFTFAATQQIGGITLYNYLRMCDEPYFFNDLFGLSEEEFGAIRLRDVVRLPGWRNFYRYFSHMCDYSKEELKALKIKYKQIKIKKNEKK